MVGWARIFSRQRSHAALPISACRRRYCDVWKNKKEQTDNGTGVRTHKAFVVWQKPLHSPSAGSFDAQKKYLPSISTAWQSDVFPDAMFHAGQTLSRGRTSHFHGEGERVGIHASNNLIFSNLELFDLHIGFDGVDVVWTFMENVVGLRSCEANDMCTKFACELRCAASSFWFNFKWKLMGRHLCWGLWKHRLCCQENWKPLSGDARRKHMKLNGEMWKHCIWIHRVVSLKWYIWNPLPQ